MDLYFNFVLTHGIWHINTHPNGQGKSYNQVQFNGTKILFFYGERGRE